MLVAEVFMTATGSIMPVCCKWVGQLYTPLSLWHNKDYEINS